MAGWTTADDAGTVTGRDVAEADLAVATAAIELHSGRFRDDPANARDARWLALAVAYQAAWLLDQPDYLERRNTASESADGQSVAAFNADTHTLAPLARKALRRLSTSGNRTIHVVDRRTRDSAEAADDALPWRPL